MVPAGNKDKRFSLVNHTAKTIHHHHYHGAKHSVLDMVTIPAGKVNDIALILSLWLSYHQVICPKLYIR